MKKLLMLCLLVFSFPAQALELPDKIYLKSPSQSFTRQFEVSILDGRIWHRPKSAQGKNPRKWELLGETGLPRDSSMHPLGLGELVVPSSVTELSADGDNLIAIGGDNLVYYMKWSTRKWTDKWGKPLSKTLRLPEKNRSWSISHRGHFAGGYHDIDGNFHPISAGVTTLYALSEDGLNISYADPWLPADFSHEICGPLRNRFRVRALDASASTIFVIGDTGEMFTRLADYDTMGHNPFLDYSYERKKRNIPKDKDVRTLPPEEWKKQPSVNRLQGQITSAITIIQTGRGNESRELRIEGVNAQGAHGYFSKPLNSGEWTFTQTNLPLQKPLLSSGNVVSDWGPDLDQNLAGYLRFGRLSKTREYEAELRNFNPLCSGAALLVRIGKDQAEFPFLTTASSRADRKMEGAVVLPDEMKTKAANNKLLQEFIKNMFNGKSFVKIKITMNDSGIVKVQSQSFFSPTPEVNIEFSKYVQ